MRVLALLFTAILAAASARRADAQTVLAAGLAVHLPASSDERGSNLPVSLDKIKEALEQTPAISLRTLDERPTFRVQIRERQRIEELLATLNYKTRRHPAAALRLRDAASDVAVGRQPAAPAVCRL